MEAMTNLQRRAYEYGDGICFEIVHNFSDHQYDIWMFRQGTEQRTYLDSMSDQTNKVVMMKSIRKKIASAVG